MHHSHCVAECVREVCIGQNTKNSARAFLRFGSTSGPQPSASNKYTSQLSNPFPFVLGYSGFIPAPQRALLISDSDMFAECETFVFDSPLFSRSLVQLRRRLQGGGRTAIILAWELSPSARP